MLDILHKCDNDKKVDYIWYDTGLEYQATKDHLKELEKKYGIEIKTGKAIKPIPTTCKQYGQPFLSKRISDYMHRLQAHDFKWEDEPYEVLIKKYPKCKAALRWWTCDFGEDSAFSISRNKYLKEFIVANPPTFKISDACCKYAKKNVAHKYIAEGGYDLNAVGVRKAEGGVRAQTYKNCFSKYDGCDEYRPLFFYKNEDKKDYEDACNIVHSRCYTEYGLERTGCAGCPFGKDFEYELEVIQKHEPKLYKAVNNIFGDSYDYTRKYKKFYEDMDKKYGSYKNYLREQKM